MKKLFSLAAVVLFALAATFAQSNGDKIISVDNFNEPWIIGTWTLELQSSDNGQNEKESTTCEITGCNDTSLVKITEADGNESEETLKQIKDVFVRLLKVGARFKKAESMGAELTGSPNLYLNASKTKVFYSTGVSFQGESASVTVVMQKK